MNELTQDRDTATLADGRTIRLRIEPDMDYDPFTETDFYGKLYALTYNRDTGRSERPRECDGNAEKLSILNDVVWWQPPSDVSRSHPDFAKFRQLVADLASFGAKIVTLEVLDGTDAYGHSIVVEVASLCGIDSLDDGYLDEVVSDLMSELDVSLADESVSA